METTLTMVDESQIKEYVDRASRFVKRVKEFSLQMRNMLQQVDDSQLLESIHTTQEPIEQEPNTIETFEPLDETQNNPMKVVDVDMTQPGVKIVTPDDVDLDALLSDIDLSLDSGLDV